MPLFIHLLLINRLVTHLHQTNCFNFIEKCYVTHKRIKINSFVLSYCLFEIYSNTCPQISCVIVLSLLIIKGTCQIWDSLKWSQVQTMRAYHSHSTHTIPYMVFKTNENWQFVYIPLCYCFYSELCCNIHCLCTCYNDSMY